MAGSVIRVGWYSTGSTPDLAHVVANTQRVYAADTSGGSSSIIWYALTARVGSNGGAKTYRLAVWNTATGQGSRGAESRVPNTVLGRTAEFSTSAAYTGGGGGETVTRNLETPFVGANNAGYAMGAASKSSSLVVGMTQAANIPTAHNTWFYDKAATNAVPQNSYSSTVNAGHLAISLIGEANVAPTAPTSLSPSGTITSRTPAIAANFNDANRVLNNGVTWDRVEKARIQVRRAVNQQVMWDHTYTTSSSERNANRSSITYAGAALLYETTYEYRIQHFDRLGAAGSFSGWQSFIISHPNSNPHPPKNFTGGGTVIATRTVTIGAQFSDPNYPYLADGQAWEWFDAKHIVVRRASDNVAVWDSGTVTATTTERSNARSSTTYTLPAWDVEYVWHERHRDRKGAWGNTATTTVIARSGGSVDKPTAPVGRVTNTVDPGNIKAVYRNTASINATKWQIGLFNSGGQGLAYSPEFEPAGGIPNDMLMEANWAATTFGNLADGTEYHIKVRALVTGVWTDWSAASVIHTNKRPNTPAPHSPSDGMVASVLHYLDVTATDPDDSAVNLSVTAHLYDLDNNHLGDVPLPIHPTAANRFRAVPSAIITGYRAFKWNATATDGFLVSPVSATRTYIFAEVPSVSITAPVGPVVTTSTPELAWSSADQTHWRVIGYLDGVVVYDTGEQAGSIKTHTISQASYWKPGQRWRNLEEIEWEVQVRDSTTLWGTSSRLALRLEYVPPHALEINDLETGTRSFPHVDGTHYGQIAFQQSQAVEGDFVHYAADRVEITGPDGAEIEGTLIQDYIVEGNSSQTMFADFDMTSGQWYRYALRQALQINGDTIESNPVHVELMVSFYGVLMHMPFDPLSTFVWMPFGTEKYEPEVEWMQGGSEIMPVRGRAPIQYVTDADYAIWRIEATFVDREGMSVAQQRDAFRRMWTYQTRRSPNGRPNSVCFREGRGGDDARLYGFIRNPRRAHSYSRLYTVDFEFVELEAHAPIDGGAP